MLHKNNKMSVKYIFVHILVVYNQVFFQKKKCIVIKILCHKCQKKSFTFKTKDKNFINFILYQCNNIDIKITVSFF